MSEAKLSPNAAYVLISAVRYQLPRRTYGSTIVADYIEANLKAIEDADLMAIRLEIRKARERDEIDPMDDRWAWRPTTDLIDRELEVRRGRVTPGSPEAVALGCTCPILDNGSGRGRGDGMFWQTAGCPIHTTKEKEDYDE